jgi:hypothetical protein
MRRPLEMASQILSSVISSSLIFFFFEEKAKDLP